MPKTDPRIADLSEKYRSQHVCCSYRWRVSPADSPLGKTRPRSFPPPSPPHNNVIAPRSREKNRGGLAAPCNCYDHCRQWRLLGARAARETTVWLSGRDSSALFLFFFVYSGARARAIRSYSARFPDVLRSSSSSFVSLTSRFSRRRIIYSARSTC